MTFVRLRHRIHELEGEVIGYKQILDAQPGQEPVAWMVWGEDNVPSLTFKKPSDKYVFDSLYTTTPKRKPLTDEEIKMLIPKGDAWKYEVGFNEAIEFARAIETAHGIKE